MSEVIIPVFGRPILGGWADVYDMATGHLRQPADDDVEVSFGQSDMLAAEPFLPLIARACDQARRDRRRARMTRKRRRGWA